MKLRTLLSLVLTVILSAGILAATPVYAADTTASTTVATTADDTGTSKKSTGKQILILLAFAAGVGILAAAYGLISMHYNADKMAEMTEESRKIIEKMNDRES